MVCTFFGHSDCPEHIRSELKSTIEGLIVDHSVNVFYVGNHGAFDRMVRGVLTELKRKYPQIVYSVVLAYFPGKGGANDIYADTILADGVENVPQRFAIAYRNRWMIEKSDYVISYVKRSFGGAAQFAALAERKGKQCINLALTESVEG